MHIEAREALLWIKTKDFSEVRERGGLCQCAPQERFASALGVLSLSLSLETPHLM